MSLDVNVTHYYLESKIKSQWTPSGWQAEHKFFDLRGQQQLFMDVSSCTGPIVKEELQAISLIGVRGEFTAIPVSSQFRKTALPLDTHAWKNTKS